MRVVSEWAGRTRRGFAALGLIGALCFARAAHADEPVTSLSSAQDSGERPWAKGVTAEQQRAASERFLAGNALLKESFFAEAANKYREALTHWDHPGIHYNLGLALLTLDQPVETHEHLKRALAYGPAPLDADKFDHAKNLLLVIDGQLADVQVTCSEPGATVRLDGQVLFHAPGKYKGLVRRGEHTVTASKPGYETTQRTQTLGSALTVLDLKLYRPDDLVGHRRRWPMWGPVALTAGGAALLGAGALFTLQSRAKFNDFDDSIASRPECKTGCLPNDEENKLHDQGSTFKTIAAVSYITGGAALAGGIVLLIMNRETTYRLEPGANSAGLSLMPAAGPGLMGVVGSGHF
ncbi:MAG TPA: PEGA domain-containing protein [Polyangiaceae bacterium]|jgi:tetratricopeptide (TPR) repeat protein|nr:PEGA domain-containing protein [Polyangiaceae bacterium]